MKSRVTIFGAFTLCIFCLGSSAVAQFDAESISIVFDIEYPLSYDTTIAGPVDAYLVVRNPVDSEIFGFEVAINSTDGELLVEVVSIFGGHENTLSGGEISAMFDVPLESSEITVLAQLQFVIVNADECLYMTGVENPSFASSLPLVWSSVSSPRPIEPYVLLSNGVSAVVAGWENPILIEIDPPCAYAVSTRSASWGAVKSIYR